MESSPGARMDAEANVLAEANSVVARLTQVIRKETNRSISDLQVVVTSEGNVTIRGKCRWYHRKKQAQDLVLPLLGDRRLTNCIEVVRDLGKS